ncbi:MAG: hypothetical protein AAGK17_11625 [Pseudomonadota bacterium]
MSINALPDRIPHGFTIAATLLAAAILFWGWWSSGREYSGCFELDRNQVLQIGHQGAAVYQNGQLMGVARISDVQRTRGYIFTLEERFVPDGSSSQHFFFGSDDELEGWGDVNAGSNKVSVLQRHGSAQLAIVNLINGDRREFSKITCPE